MGRHRSRPHTAAWVAVGIVAGIVVVSSAAATLPRALGQGVDGPARQARSAGTPCATGYTLRVTTAASFAGVLEKVAPAVATGPDCVRLKVTVADGRAAAEGLSPSRTDVWIPDDTAWKAFAPDAVLAPTEDAGAGTVLATSPVYMVTDPATGERIREAGGSWVGLSALVSAPTGVRLLVREPAGSGDGLVGAGALGEAVWLRSGMDASSKAMVRTVPHTRTVAGSGSALPRAAGVVGLVPEYAVMPQLASGARNAVVLSGTDRAALLRYTWFPTARAAGTPESRVALYRVLMALTGVDATDLLGAAHLRPPDHRAPPGGTDSRLPRLAPATFGALQPHHADHILATFYPEDRRANLLLVVDVSGSMGDAAPGSRTPLITLVRSGLKSVGELLPADSRLGLWAFGAELDPPRDYRPLLAVGTLDRGHRAAFNRAVERLRAEPTGTGLYDTILAAYRAAQQAYRPGVPNQVLVFTDGRNEDDPGSLTSSELADRLRDAADPRRPVDLAVVAFGSRPEADVLKRVLEPIGGYLSEVTSADQVAGVFVHVAVGGLRTR